MRNVCQFYNAEVEQKIQKEKELLFWFDTAIQNQELQIYLQPQVPFNKTKMIQAEALVRWYKPEGGMIYPNDFIPLLEKNNRIDHLDMYVFEQVCKIIVSWIANKRPIIEVSVNISGEHLKHKGVNIWKEYCKIKEKYQIPDGVLKLELTENTMFELPELSAVREIINGFHSCGLKVALDDFGFAYSSLILLKEFDIDILKLDRAFFIDENKKSKKIVSNMIRLAHELDVMVVAEGIEEQAQVKELNGMKCDYIQGYIYSEPIPVTDFEEWVTNYHHL